MTRHELINAGPARIEVLVDGFGPCVVVLPSSQRDSRGEDELAHPLATAGYMVLRPQPRGMGHSEGPLDGMTLADLADDVAAAIQQLGGGRAVVLGHAFGHFVARVTDLLHPACVRGVVLLGAAARTFPPGLTEALDTAADYSQPRAARLQALRAALFAAGNDPTPWLDGWHPHLRPYYRAASAEPPKAVWWSTTNAPILEVQGAQDPWRPPHTRNELRDVLGDKVTVQTIEGASHALIPERPVEVARAVISWMQTLPA
jgi:pimeloyl-ACP methyl ester carboxylesterase